MLINLAASDDLECDVDVCVIGSGPAGVTVATALARRGFSCALVESGGLRRSAAGRDLNRGSASGQPSWPLTASRVRCLGGTSTEWHGWCRPLEPDDLTARPWIDPRGWPLAFDELRPWYLEAQALCHAGDYRYDDVAGWLRDAGQPALDVGGDLENRLYAFSPRVDFAAESIATLTSAPGLFTFVDATVTALELDGNRGAIRRVVAESSSGRRLAVRARSVVLAMGAIENARALLIARARGFAGGGPWLGRSFLDHPHLFAGLLRPRDVHALRAYTEPTASPGGWGRLVLAMSSAAAARLRLPGATAVLQPLAGDGEALALLIRAEQRPNADSRVTLSREVDCFGLPRPHVHWALDATDRQAVSTFAERLAAEVSRLGAGALQLDLPGAADAWPRDTVGGCHHLGATRMATDVNDGVVDRDGRVFGSDNLYVAGSSLFRTGGVANPTLSIVAFALRLAAHLATRLALPAAARLHPRAGAVTVAAASEPAWSDEPDETGQFLAALATNIAARARSLGAGERSGA